MTDKFDYQAYLASREWAVLKRAVRERASHRCERCGYPEIAATHHLTYERVGREALGDLQGVCAPCHEYLSALCQVDPAEYAIPDDFNDACAFLEFVIQRWGARFAAHYVAAKRLCERYDRALEERRRLKQAV